MSRAFVLGLFDTGLAVVRALGREGIDVRGFDYRPGMPGFHSRFGRHEICPDAVSEPDALTRFLVDRARDDSTPAILYPTSDAFVSFVSEHREQLEARFRYALPPRDVVARAIDKRFQYAIAREAGIPIATTYNPESLEDVAALARTLEFPVVVKPNVGHLWRQRYRSDKAVLVQTPDALARLFRDIFMSGQSALVQSFILGPNSNHCKVCA